MSLSTEVSSVNLDELLAPLPGSNPAGSDTKFSGLHDRIREARRADDNLPTGDWSHEPKRADWPLVMRLATDALTFETKDLQIAAWLIEALVRMHGLAGLRDGLKLLRELIEQFWETIYPLIEYPDMDDSASGPPQARGEGDLLARVNILESLSWQLAVLIKEVPLTNYPSGENYAYQHWQETKVLNDPARSKQLGSDDRQRLETLTEQWRLAKNGTKVEFYDTIIGALNKCGEGFTSLDQVIDERFGRQAPSLGAIKKSLAEVKDLVEEIIKEKRPSAAVMPPPGQPQSPPMGPQPLGNAASTPAVSGPVRTRQEAFARLGEVASYFRQAEPHNPASYVVELAIKWGQMNLEQWLQDAVKNNEVLENLREALGLKQES